MAFPATQGKARIPGLVDKAVYSAGLTQVEQLKAR